MRLAAFCWRPSPFWGQTARSLHIHRQSLSYRLEKIEQLTGMSLGSHEDLFLLEVYSRIYRSY